MDDRYTSYGRSAGRNTTATPPPEDYPVVPLPPVVPDDQMPAPNPDDTPVIPLPPIVGEPDQPPAANPDQTPVVPLPPIVGNPDQGYPPQYPADPGPGGIIVLPGLISPSYCTVRFLNAAAGYEPLRITIGNRLVNSSLPYGSMGSYVRVSDGFRVVTISNPLAPRSIFYQQTIPFNAGELITMAIVRTNTGLDLVRISDVPCRNRPAGRACIRAVNLNFGSPALDVLLNDGRMVFNDVRYKEVTTFKQARPRDYGFYIAQTSYTPTPYFQDIETVEETPLVAPNYFLPGYGGVTPLVSFYVDAKRNGVYTIYILGTWNYANPLLRVKVVEDFQ